jgi:hypothetical protein
LTDDKEEEERFALHSHAKEEQDRKVEEGRDRKKKQGIRNRQEKYHRARTRAELSRHDDSLLGYLKGVDILLIFSVLLFRLGDCG